ncbi:ATP-binding protein [uncultured Bacteroides sp.]|uniref:ATP-binding protein n=1 Tax=uncultured Bacteroides sp. TaxID=162156 RepID=UPI00267685A5|nr:HAMP domain-containing sensor histidine kinase [uncultured Bacteroides sp.]
MFSIRLYIHILLFVSLIVLTFGLGLAGIISGRAVILGTIAVLIAFWLIGALVHYLNSCNRKIKLFFDSIEDSESMLYFPENTGTWEQRYLHASFNRIYTLVTEHKKREFEHKLHQKEYESWEKLMRVLTHEIMNSITPIVSLSETLLSYFPVKCGSKHAGDITDLTIEKTIRGLKTIKDQGENLIYFTESYRQFSGLNQPEFSSFSLTELIQNIQTLYQEDLLRQRIELSIDFFQPEIQIYADEKMLSQVLINLLKNSIQALTEQPDKKIHINVYSNETMLFIKITDNGSGIPSNLLEDIFIPFFTTKKHGTGIGLSLSQQIIRMHGGELSVISQPHHETSFTVSLPLKSYFSSFGQGVFKQQL